jgi:DNA-binding transcriptional LysR family regulator
VDLSHLEVLIAVAQEKGFSRAAERLHRTQPAVSQAIRRLEADLGQPLVDRSSKDGTLTDAGRVLYEYAQQLVNLRRDAKTALAELGSVQRGRLIVSANEYTVVPLLPLIVAYRAQYPNVMVEVRRSLASRIPAEVLGRDAEFGMVTFRPTQASLASLPVATDELALLVAPDHALAGRREVSVRELGVESFVAHNVRSPYRERVVATFEKHRTPLNIVAEMPSLEAIKRLVERGLGVALMPRQAAAAEVSRGDLVALSVREMRLERRLYLVYRKGADLSHAGRAFLACARVTAARPTR